MMIPYFVFLLATIFSVSAVSKLLTLDEFKKTLYDIGVPRRYLILMSLHIPIVELVSVILLLIPNTRVAGIIVILLLLTMFMLVSVKAIIHKKKINCNCFGNLLPGQLGWVTLIRVFVLVILSILILFTHDVQLFNIPQEELFYQIFAAIGIFASYAVASKIIGDLHDSRKGGSMKV